MTFHGRSAPIAGTGALVACVALVAATSASAQSPAADHASPRVVPQKSIRGVRLGWSSERVRSVLGRPDKIQRRSHPIAGRELDYVYGLMRVSMLDNSGVIAITTTSRKDRTARGVGVGSLRATVRRKVPRARCAIEFGLDHCWVGTFTAARTVTDFRIARGRVASITLGYVID